MGKWRKMLLQMRMFANTDYYSLSTDVFLKKSILDQYCPIKLKNRLFKNLID